MQAIRSIPVAPVLNAPVQVQKAVQPPQVSSLNTPVKKQEVSKKHPVSVHSTDDTDADSPF